MKQQIHLLNGMMKIIHKIMINMQYRCSVCNFIYDTIEGDISQGIKPGTPFEKLPEDWKCPVCGADKEYFDYIS